MQTKAKNLGVLHDTDCTGFLNPVAQPPITAEHLVIYNERGPHLCLHLTLTLLQACELLLMNSGWYRIL